MKRLLTFVLLMASLFTLGAACDFYFEVASTSVSLKEVFYVKVTVVQTHNRCTLTSMDDYHFDTDGFGILGKTAWKEIKPGVFETWLKVESIEKGDGWIKIYKDCTKEGYQEEVLSMSIV
ncbi:MAG TPA: hypothetical protein PKM99_05560 [Thermotogota bacterium]|nr:hypothetical protein [Thermotogota bacterium]NLZ13141.1 hypothetical protein [Thermotogaceae bacterium]MDD8041713.1 hypothetical protein [Thermotogota bacterium]HNR63804.1 hypothetical protein [Thermotogota bacterium]HNT95565.1 hypothetical protein [Thermotogota bacterium]